MLPPTYLMLALVAMAALHFLFPGPRLVSGVWRLIGVAIAAFGSWFTIWADAVFKRRGTTVKPFQTSTVIVDEGPFAVSRHPMYVGFSAVLLGAAVLAGTTAAFLVSVATVWLFVARFAIPEERHMEKQFGDEYRSYAARVRRWV